MKKYQVKLESNSAILFGRQYSVPKLQKESAHEYEQRTWSERLHRNTQGNVVLNPLSLKNCLRDAAKYLGEPIPGKGKATYTKHFRAGIMVVEDILLTDPKGRPIIADSVEPLWLNVPSDGMTGGTKRVPKAFPRVSEWQATAEIAVLDDTITEKVLRHHLIEAGNFVGLGAMRVANGGISGRFKVVSLAEVK
jgi:hypothetical protein